MVAGQQEKGETMSEHPGQVYQKPPKSWATLPSGMRYFCMAEIWRPCFGFCALTILAVDPSSTFQVTSLHWGPERTMLPFAQRRQPMPLPLLSLDTQGQGPDSSSLEEKPRKPSGYHCFAPCGSGSPAESPKSQASLASQQPQLSGLCNVLERYDVIVSGLSGFGWPWALGRKEQAEADNPC